jgi:hypothetical protein
MENSAHSVTKSIILYVCTARTPNVEILRDSIKIPVLITCTKEPSEYWTPSSIKNTFLVFYIYFFLLKILVSKRETGGNGSIRLQLGTMLCIFMYCRRFWPKRFVKMSIFLKTNVSIMLLCKLLFFGVEVAVFSTSFFLAKMVPKSFHGPGSTPRNLWAVFTASLGFQGSGCRWSERCSPLCTSPWAKSESKTREGCRGQPGHGGLNFNPSKTDLCFIL